MNVQEAIEILEEIHGDIQRTLSKLSKGNSVYQDDYIGSIDYRYDEEDSFQEEVVFDILYKLTDVSDSLSYLRLPVRETGVLRKNQEQKFVLNDKTLGFGSPIEIYVFDEGIESYTWTKTYVDLDVETNGYYLNGYEDIRTDDLKARIRF